MHHTLRMNNYANASHLDVKEPPRLNHFEALIKKSGRIDGDLSAHDPGRMFEGSLDSDAVKVLLRGLAKWATGSCQPKFAHGTGGLAVQTLKYGGVLAVDGQNANAMSPCFIHYDFPCHDQDFLGSNGNIFAGADRRQSGLQPGCADNGN